MTRLLLDPPLAGAVNMARDELLLSQAIEHGVAAIRWYQWRPATLSLGYFQDDEPGVRSELPRVRRLSGGGAIVHDAEWTYSVAAPSGLLGDSPGLYGRVHEAILAEAKAAGVSLAMRGEDEPALDDSFLCFGRGDRHDILTGRRKVVGSAQRRRGGAVLQHGSVALDIPVGGVPLGESLEYETFTGRVSRRVVGGSPIAAADWTAAELTFADDWAARKYATLDWQGELRRGPHEVPSP